MAAVKKKLNTAAFKRPVSAVQPVAARKPAVVALPKATKPAAVVAAKTKAKTRKRSAAAEEDDKSWRSREMPVEAFWHASCAAVTKKTGNVDIITSGESEARIIGIPFPSLSLAYLFGNTVLPLGRSGQIVGLPGSCKTLFLWFLQAMHLEYGGVTTNFANEGKDSPDLRNSIFNHRKSWMNRSVIHPTFALEDWMEGLIHWIKIVYQQCDPTGRIPTFQRKAKGKGKGGSKSEEDEDTMLDLIEADDIPNSAEAKRARKQSPGYGWKIPIGFSVDSLMSTPPREQGDKILLTGSPERSFPIGANLLSAYCKLLPRLIDNKPITFWGTNHLKPTTDSAGRPSNNIPGGQAFKFMETFRLIMRRISLIDRTNRGGALIELKCDKNSLGQTGAKLQATVMWEWVKWNDGKYRQYTFWDWHSATTDMLLARSKLTVSMANQIYDIVDINASPKTRRAWSKTLGIPKSSPVTYHEIGRLIDNSPEIRFELSPLLNISTRGVFAPGVAFRDAVEQGRKGDFSVMTSSKILSPDLEDLQTLASTLASRSQRRPHDDDDVELVED